MTRLLLCAPDHFRIEYEINPWMDRRQGADPEISRAQWEMLRDTLQKLGCEIELVSPQLRLPDMVFTANAGLVVDNRFIRSNFRFRERHGEAAHFERWFLEHGYDVVRLPDNYWFEGEGDALFWGNVLFCGYRFRSDIKSHQYIGDLLQCLVISLELTDERWYHLDTCFCPLPDGSVLWYPDAFDEYGQRAIREHIGELIEVSMSEASRFACNAVPIGQDIVLPDGCPQLVDTLTSRGWQCHEVPMSEFLKAGGACKCLTLFLPQR
jgi:N-dimethylarginine dimethylaminohydrolase